MLLPPPSLSLPIARRCPTHTMNSDALNEKCRRSPREGCQTIPDTNRRKLGGSQSVTCKAYAFVTKNIAVFSPFSFRNLEPFPLPDNIFVSRPTRTGKFSFTHYMVPDMYPRSPRARTQHVPMISWT